MHSGIVVERKQETDPSMSRDLRANSLIEMSSDEDNYHAPNRQYEKEETPKEIKVCDEMADKMSA